MQNPDQANNSSASVDKPETRLFTDRHGSFEVPLVSQHDFRLDRGKMRMRCYKCKELMNETTTFCHGKKVGVEQGEAERAEHQNEAK